MQKIYINGRFFTQKITGEQRYAIEMINALDELLYKSSSNAFIISIAYLCSPVIFWVKKRPFIYIFCIILSFLFK